MTHALERIPEPLLLSMAVTGLTLVLLLCLMGFVFWAIGID